MRVRPANKPPKGGGIWGTMDRLSKLLHASMRPLPTETGDFSYITAPQETGLLQDLENLDMKDYETVIRLFKNAATGDLVNDRTYEMENIIRVSSSFSLCAIGLLATATTNSFLLSLRRRYRVPRRTVSS
jgi:linoleate 8R-lipoxygenase/9,12-octadecadienoate 8-hydroperoxide 8R-isomerase